MQEGDSNFRRGELRFDGYYISRKQVDDSPGQEEYDEPFYYDYILQFFKDGHVTEWTTAHIADDAEYYSIYETMLRTWLKHGWVDNDEFNDNRCLHLDWPYFYIHHRRIYQRCRLRRNGNIKIKYTSKSVDQLTLKKTVYRCTYTGEVTKDQITIRFQQLGGWKDQTYVFEPIWKDLTYDFEKFVQQDDTPWKPDWKLMMDNRNR